jgi:hypothetical protein
LTSLTLELFELEELYRSDDIQYNASAPYATNSTAYYVDASTETLRGIMRAMIDVMPTYVAWSWHASTMRPVPQ